MAGNYKYFLLISICVLFSLDVDASNVSKKSLNEQKIRRAITHRVVDFGKCLIRAKKGDDQIGEITCQSIVSLGEDEYRNVGHCLSSQPKFFIQASWTDKSADNFGYFVEVLCKDFNVGIAIAGKGISLEIESVGAILP